MKSRSLEPFRRSDDPFPSDPVGEDGAELGSVALALTGSETPWSFSVGRWSYGDSFLALLARTRISSSGNVSRTGGSGALSCGFPFDKGLLSAWASETSNEGSLEVEPLDGFLPLQEQD